MTLEATFNLTPRESHYREADDKRASFSVHGDYFAPHTFQGNNFSFEGQYQNDWLSFELYNAVDPALDYANWQIRRLVPYMAVL